MKIKGLQDEDFVNYRQPSMVIITSYCTFKCDKEIGGGCCQNSPLADSPIVDMPNEKIIQRYLGNKITKSIVFGGLEPFEQFDEMYELIREIREFNFCDDTIVIYTGFYKEEIIDKIILLSQYKNIIVKYGRFIPHQNKHYDDILGVWLASDNQYAERIS